MVPVHEVFQPCRAWAHGGGLCSVEMPPQLSCCSLPALGVKGLCDSCLPPTVSPSVEQNEEAFIQPGLPHAVHAFSIFL